ncbi:MAG: hypothetical protein D6757_01415, partial [Alphaproteobacteria bacterium]
MSGIFLGNQQFGYVGEVIDVTDFNNDGIDDYVVQNPSINLGKGAVDVIFGRREGFPEVFTLDDLAPGEWIRLVNSAPTTTFPRFGEQIVSGDFNGDGLNDLAISAPGDSTGGLIGNGTVSIFHGRTPQETENFILDDLGGTAFWDAQSFDGITGRNIAGNDDGMGLGSFLTNPGDIDEDGVDELVIGTGAPGGEQTLHILYNGRIDLAAQPGVAGIDDFAPPEILSLKAPGATITGFEVLPVAWPEGGAADGLFDVYSSLNPDPPDVFAPDDDTPPPGGLPDPLPFSNLAPGPAGEPILQFSETTGPEVTETRLTVTVPEGWTRVESAGESGLTFTFMPVGAMDGAAITITVPAGWTSPGSGSPGGAPYEFMPEPGADPFGSPVTIDVAVPQDRMPHDPLDLGRDPGEPDLTIRELPDGMPPPPPILIGGDVAPGDEIPGRLAFTITDPLGSSSPVIVDFPEEGPAGRFDPSGPGTDGLSLLLTTLPEDNDGIPGEAPWVGITHLDDSLPLSSEPFNLGPPPLPEDPFERVEITGLPVSSFPPDKGGGLLGDLNGNGTLDIGINIFNSNGGENVIIDGGACDLVGADGTLDLTNPAVTPFVQMIMGPDEPPPDPYDSSPGWYRGRNMERGDPLGVAADAISQYHHHMSLEERIIHEEELWEQQRLMFPTIEELWKRLGNLLFGGFGTGATDFSFETPDGPPGALTGLSGTIASNGGVLEFYANANFTDNFTLDPTQLDGSNGFRVHGETAFGGFGWDFVYGDVNGDRIDDVIVSAPFTYTDTEFGLGAIYTVTGGLKNLRAQDHQDGVIDGNIVAGLLNETPPLRAGLIITSEEDFSDFGTAFAALGDINGDGLNDFLIGEPEADAGGDAGAGRGVVLFGDANFGMPELDLAGLTTAQGFFLEGIAPGDMAGAGLGGPGDVNGDGLADILIGAPGEATGAGAGHGVYGRQGAGPFALHTGLDTLGPTTGFAVAGRDPGDMLGATATGLGDINGDGRPDFAFAAPEADPGTAPMAGEIFVVFGQAGDLPQTIAPGDLDGTTGFVIQGAAANDLAGSTISPLGDINGDGFDDVAIGSPGEPLSGPGSEGAVDILFGTDLGFPALLPLGGGSSLRLSGLSEGDNLGGAMDGR